MVKIDSTSRKAAAKPTATPPTTATPAVDLAGVAAKVRARGDAGTVITLAQEMAATHAGPALLAFWFEIVRAAMEFQWAVEKTLTDQERSNIAFGKFDERAPKPVEKVAERPRVVPNRQPEQAAALAIQEIDDALDEIGDIPSRGAEFAESVQEKLEGIRETIEETGHVSAGQQAAIANMSDGIKAWLR